MSAAAKRLAAIALAGAGLASVCPWSWQHEAAPAARSASQAATVAPVPAPATGAIASADHASAVPASADRSHQLELPDGSFVPALNDAVGATGLAQFWGPLPWSPIVAVERSSAGLDWFRHEDGSYSTTQMVWRSDLGRYDAMTRVAHPGPAPAPVAKR